MQKIFLFCPLHINMWVCASVCLCMFVFLYVYVCLNVTGKEMLMIFVKNRREGGGRVINMYFYAKHIQWYVSICLSITYLISISYAFYKKNPTFIGNTPCKVCQHFTTKLIWNIEPKLEHPKNPSLFIVDCS